MLLAALAPVHAATETPQKILVIHSFGREIEPYDTIASSFRTELAREATRPLAIYEASLDAGQPLVAGDDELLVKYLGDRFRSITPDVVVTLGPPAARFYSANRSQLFPSTPYVMAGLERRLAPTGELRPGDSAVTTTLDFGLLLEHILKVLPDLRTLAVVIGDSPVERYWAGEIQKAFAPYADRLEFVWLNKLPLEGIRQRAAQLPPRSAIFYASLRVDAAGVPQERQRALDTLHDAANAPIFGFYESELGKGIVGGPYVSQSRRGAKVAQATLRALRGERAAEPEVVVLGLEPPVYDGRELGRWQIASERLAPAATVSFQPPNPWRDHLGFLLAFGTLLVLQTVLIAALAFQRRQRRRAEREAQNLGGRLITAHEDERRRIARELHDDVTQRIARLSIDAARIQPTLAGPRAQAAALSLREGLVRLSEDVHALSYKLHPAVLEDLGLVEALKAEGESMSRRESIGCNVELHAVPPNVPKEVALCLFRIAQEALRNVARHAHARKVDVSLATSRGGLELVVSDNGTGFDASGGRDHPSLGLASMRERVRALGGVVRVESLPGRGTTILAWVPLGGRA